MIRRRGVTLSDAIVVLLILVLACAYGLAARLRVDDVESRVNCARNLRAIGQALLLYANENKGAYPRTIFQPGENPTPVWGTPYEGNDQLEANAKSDPFAKDDAPEAPLKPKPNDVTAALYLLMRTQEITSAQFVCPATLKDPWDFGGGQNHALFWTNWRGNKVLRDHLSYSYQNPYPSNAARESGYKLSALSAEFVVAGDMNPGTDALLKLNPRSPHREIRAGNSPNHSRDGQNFLYGDGHVEFQSTPFCGVKLDNVYTYGPSGHEHPESGGEGIVGSPVDGNDSILLPTARDIGAADEKGDLIDSVKVQPLTADEARQMRRNLTGTYARTDEQRRTIRLQVSDDKLIASSGPLTATFSYKIAGLVGERVRLTLTAPETEAATAFVTVEKDGLTIRGPSYVAGTWKRQ